MNEKQEVQSTSKFNDTQEMKEILEHLYALVLMSSKKNSAIDILNPKNIHCGDVRNCLLNLNIGENLQI